MVIIMLLVLISILGKKLSVKYALLLEIKHISVETCSIRASFLETELLVVLGVEEVRVTEHLVVMVILTLAEVLAILMVLVYDLFIVNKMDHFMAMVHIGLLTSFILKVYQSFEELMELMATTVVVLFMVLQQPICLHGMLTFLTTILTFGRL